MEEMSSFYPKKLEELKNNQKIIWKEELVFPPVPMEVEKLAN